MSYLKPDLVLEESAELGAAKTQLTVVQLLARGALAAAILACSTTFAFTATSQTGIPLVGAIVFPVGLVIIVLLGLELVTGSFAIIPLAVFLRRATSAGMLRNFFWVIVGHVVGCLVYAVLYVAVVTRLGTDSTNPVASMIVAASEAKTIGYESMGAAGIVLVFIKAVLCNWLVTLAVILALTSSSTGGKILAMWLPVTVFFSQGFEHAVVNLFVIPAGMMLGAHVTVAEWWVWNQLPVFAGNIVGAVILTSSLFLLSHRVIGRRTEALAEFAPIELAGVRAEDGIRV